MGSVKKEKRRVWHSYKTSRILTLVCHSTGSLTNHLPTFQLCYLPVYTVIVLFFYSNKGFFKISMEMPHQKISA